MKLHLSAFFISWSWAVAATPAFASPFLMPSSFIMQGSTVEAGDPVAATTVALLNQSGGRLSLCSGTIVAEDLVLTAGHCVGPARAGMRLAFTTDIHEKPAAIAAAGYARPEDYRDSDEGVDGRESMNDLALVRFEGGLPPGYEAAKFLADPDQLRDGQTVTLAGYGVTAGGRGLEDAGVLRKVEVPIAQADFGPGEVLMDQSDGRGACHGDSGGPAFLRVRGEYRLFGITSRGISSVPADCQGGAIYTNALAHADFLRAAARWLRAGNSLP